MNELEWIQQYYLKCCDGDWEHDYGIKISNIDNPGWALDVDLTGTPLKGVNFSNIEFTRSENDWVICKVKGDRFFGRGGPLNLQELLKIFREWSLGVENNSGNQ